MWYAAVLMGRPYHDHGRHDSGRDVHGRIDLLRLRTGLHFGASLGWPGMGVAQVMRIRGLRPWSWQPWSCYRDRMTPNPLASGPRSRRDRPAKPPLTRQGIIDAALGIMRSEGLDRVTMRRIA